MPVQTSPFGDFLPMTDFSGLFENYPKNPLDIRSLLETHRKNFQALTELQQTAYENLQDIVTRNSEILSQFMEDNSLLAKEMMSEGTPEEKIAKNADIIKGIYERNIKNFKNLAQLIDASNDKTGAIISRRVTSSLNEIKSSMEKPKKAA